MHACDQQVMNLYVCYAHIRLNISHTHILCICMPLDYVYMCMGTYAHICIYTHIMHVQAAGIKLQKLLSSLGGHSICSVGEEDELNPTTGFNSFETRVWKGLIIHTCMYSACVYVYIHE